MHRHIYFRIYSGKDVIDGERQEDIQAKEDKQDIVDIYEWP